jgi:hypothetical protein
MPARLAKPNDLSGLLRPYVGQWVAMSSDRKRVIASAATFGEVLAQSRKRPEKAKPIVLRVSNQFSAFPLL